MKQIVYSLVAFLTGAVISVMVLFNTEFGNMSSNETSIIINQIVGILSLTIVMLATAKNKNLNPVRKPSKWYMYFGGCFGLIILVCNFYGVLYLGVTLSMACAVFGQSLMGLIMDLTGFMGMEKRKTNYKKIISIAISFIGILIMSIFSESSSNSNIIFILLSILAGILTMTQMSYNSTFAKSKGVLFSARQNVISGLGAALIYALIFFRPETIQGMKLVPSIPIYIILMGGLLGSVVVCSTNIVIPKIPAIYSALLMSSGQILMSIILDKMIKNIFSMPLLIGTIFILLGIFGNFLAERPEKQKSN